MIKVVFIEPGGRRREVDAQVGSTLMEVAKRHGIDGIVAQCGGACACATCHAYIDPLWFSKLAPLEDMEEGMLELAAAPRPNSRLTCQVQVTAAMAGIVVQVPAMQANQP